MAEPVCPNGLGALCGPSAIYRAPMGAQELRRAGDNAVIFDGAGSTAAAEMAQPTHRFHSLFQDVLPAVRVVRRFRAKSYGVLDALQAASLPLPNDDRGPASLRALLVEGRPVTTC